MWHVWRWEVHTEFWWRNLKKGDHLEELSIQKRIIFKWLLNRLYLRWWIGFCECGIEPSLTVKWGEFLNWVRKCLILRKDSVPWSLRVKRNFNTVRKICQFCSGVFGNLMQKLTLFRSTFLSVVPRFPKKALLLKAHVSHPLVLLRRAVLIRRWVLSTGGILTGENSEKNLSTTQTRAFEVRG